MIDRVSIENFKGTTGETFLTQLNIFRGNSGSGKSTWLEAIRVAVVGHDPGYGKLLAETMAFSSGEEMNIEVSNLQVQLKRSFALTDGKASQAILVNGEKKTAKAAEPLLAEHFGQFPMMLNPDEFFKLSDEKKIDFLFGLSSTEAHSGYLRRHCIISILKLYTEAVDYILEYEFEKADYFMMEEEPFKRLVKLVIDKVAEKDVAAGRALTKIFSEFLTKTLPNGQETLSLYYNTLKTEINATQRTKRDSESANRKLMEERTEKMNLMEYSDDDNKAQIESLREEISEIDKELASRGAFKEAREKLEAGIKVKEHNLANAKSAIKQLGDSLLSTEESDALAEEIAALEKRATELNSNINRCEGFKNQAHFKYEQELGRVRNCPDCEAPLKCDCGFVANENSHNPGHKEYEEELDKIRDYETGLRAALKAAKESHEKKSKIEEADKRGLIEFAATAKSRGERETELKEDKLTVAGLEKPGAGTEALVTQVAAIKKTLGERLVAQKNHDWLNTLSATIARANETINNSKSLLAALKSSLVAVKDIRDELTESATSVIEEACNELLKKVDPSFNLTYAIEDGKFDIRCIGVEGREVAFKTLSGGEQVLYLSAQLLALMTIVDPKLKILEVEMGELSGNLVPPFMDALEAMTEGKEIQVLLSSCHRDFEVNSNSWTVHQMGEGVE